MSKEVELSEYNKKMRGLPSQEDADDPADEDEMERRRASYRKAMEDYKQSSGIRTKKRASKFMDASTGKYYDARTGREIKDEKQN